MDGVLEYAEGMKQADIIGFSHYASNIAVSWQRAQTIFEKLNITQPFIFFEYAPDSPWSTGQNVTSQFVDDSYGMIPTHRFVKGLIWYFGSYFTQDTIIAIAQKAQIYEGYNG
jgi:hypothetical protein